MTDPENRHDKSSDNKELLERVKSLETEIERLRSKSSTERSFWSRAFLAFVIVFVVMLVGIGVVNYLYIS